MSEQRPTTPEAARAAAYLATKERLDRKGKLKCNPPNRPCGDRCIPPNWNCRVKGEGNDSHSRVVAGDPLAGAASIARGGERLRKGIAKGSLIDIQAGRGAIERGIVKAIPGQNIKQKQALRKGVNKVLVPVASTLFAGWALSRGHKGLQLLVPGYKDGLGKDIERAVTNAYEWGADRIPIYGQVRQAKKRLASLEAQRLGRAVARESLSDPRINAKTGLRALEAAGEGARKAYPGLDAAIRNAINEGHSNITQGYQSFRFSLIETIAGKKNGTDSIYSERAAADFLLRQYGVPEANAVGARGVASSVNAVRAVSSSLQRARVAMREDMELRGLTWRATTDGKQTVDVDKYADVAVQNASARFRGMPDEDRLVAEQQLKGLVRDLVTGGSVRSKPEKSTYSIAEEQFNFTKANFNVFFDGVAVALKEDLDPKDRVIQAGGNADVNTRAALIATAKRVRKEVGLDANYAVSGGNHAELILQKVWHEKVVPGSYSKRRSSTWTASDAAIRNAATDMGWNGTNVDDAAQFLRRNGFANLERSTIARPAPRETPTTPQSGGKPRRARRNSEAQMIAAMMRRRNRDGTPVFATREAALAELRRMQKRTDSRTPKDFVRTATYIALRNDFKEGKRLGKPCGKSYIPKAHKCGQSTQSEGTSETSSPATDNKKRTSLLLASAGAATATAVLGIMAKDIFTTGIPKDRIPPKQAPDGLYDSFKPGDLLYQTNEFIGADRAHYVIYLGKLNGTHKVFDTSLSKEKLASRMRVRDIDEAQDTGTSFARAARADNDDSKRPSTEALYKIVQQLHDKDYDWNGFQNNCESLARAIVNDIPVSTQTKNASKMSKVISDGLISVLAPRGYRNKAVKQNEVEKLVKRTVGDAVPSTQGLIRTATYLALRSDFKEGKRLGKPCGASHIPKAHECRKGAGGTSAPTAPEGGAATTERPSRSGTSDRLRTMATGALVAGLAVGGVAAYQNRQNIAMSAVRGLSSEQIQKGLAKVPPNFQEPVRNLVGRTKTAVAGVLMVSKGSKIVEVDNPNNMATFSLRNGDLVSISNVGDALVMFRTHPHNTIDYGGGETAGRYVVDFTVDLLHKQSKQERKQALGIARKTKTMFEKQMSYIPDNSFVTAEAYGTDGLGDKRGSIYQKYGFQPIGDISKHLWGIKTESGFRKMNKRQVYSLNTVLRQQKRVDTNKH